MNKKRNKTLSLAVQYGVDGPELPTRAQLRRWVRAAQAGDAEVTIRLVAAEEGRALNRDYRGKDYATNVLSFPYAPLPEMAGDLVLCPPVALAEAQAQGKTGQAHFAHLVVHGMLHLQGYDHETDADAASMEAKEREILARLGYPDPYADAVMGDACQR
ncbi:endoribonuclease YbeY [mine drainage metagenome]|uniref:Endoribonuclease YbeY n=1 Tax=mine drainage metagenome TaxID=410659 RepID=A0A1J5SZ49_9ZZZZ